MPTVFRLGPYRFFIFPRDVLTEPPHVHVFRDDLAAKVWLDPVRLQDAGGLRPVEVRRIVRLVEQHKQQLLEAWNAIDPNA